MIYLYDLLYDLLVILSLLSKQFNKLN